MKRRTHNDIYKSGINPFDLSSGISARYSKNSLIRSKRKEYRIWLELKGYYSEAEIKLALDWRYPMPPRK